VELLADLFAAAHDTWAVGPLLERLAGRPAETAGALRRYLASPADPRLTTEEDARRRARAAAELLRLGGAGPGVPLLRHQPDPGLRSELIHRLALAQVPAGLLLERLFVEEDVSAVRALVLALGEFPAGAVVPDDRPRLDEWLRNNY